MPTVIDSFVAEFTIDPKEFSKGAGTVRLDLKRTREDVAKTGKEFEAFGKNGAAFLSKLRNEAVGLFLAFQGASSVAGFVTDLIKGDAATARLAGNIGMTTSRLSAWQLAIRGVGGDAKEADAALGAMAEAYQSYIKTGTTGHDMEFRSLGITKIDQDPEKMLLKLAEAAERVSKTEFYSKAKAIGLSDAVINQLEQGRKATEDLVTAKEKDGAATDEDAAAAERLQKKLSDLQSKLKGAVRPAIYELVDGLEEVDKQVGLANVVIPVMTVLLGALAIAALAATWEFIAIAAAIAAAFAGAKAYMKWLDDVNTKHLIREGKVVRNELPASKAADGPPTAWPDGTPYSPEMQAKVNAAFAAKKSGGSGNAGGVDHGAIQKYLSGAGLSAEQVRGIDAGITAEGGSLGMAANGAFGIGQWRGDRAKALFAKYGRAPSLQNQLEFLVSELKGGDRGGASVMAQTSAEATMVAYLRDFMRPGPGLSGDLKRGYSALGKRAPAGAGGGASTDRSTHVGTIVVHVANGDPDKIARELPAAIKRRGIVTQADRGLA